MSEQREASHLRGDVADGLRNLQSLAKTSNSGSYIALEERQYPQFTFGAICPRSVPESLGNRLRFASRLRSQEWTKVFVRLAFDHETAQPKPII